MVDPMPPETQQNPHDGEGVCLSLFLINSGQCWVSARKYVLFGHLKALRRVSLPASGFAIRPLHHPFESILVGIGMFTGGT